MKRKKKNQQLAVAYELAATSGLRQMELTDQ